MKILKSRAELWRRKELLQKSIQKEDWIIIGYAHEHEFNLSYVESEILKSLWDEFRSILNKLSTKLLGFRVGYGRVRIQIK